MPTPKRGKEEEKERRENSIQGNSKMSRVRAITPRSVNYFISRVCNYSCKFCFHTQKNNNILTTEKAVEGLHLLKAAGCEKINFAGGEPFNHPLLLGTLCKTSQELGMAVSIILMGRSSVQSGWKSTLDLWIY